MSVSNSSSISGVGSGSSITHTEWGESYSPAILGLGSLGATNFDYMKIGNTLFIQGRVVAGTATAVELRIPLPTGMTTSSDYTANQVVGKGNRNNANGADLVVLAAPSLSYVMMSASNAATTNLTAQNGDFFLGVGEVLSVFAIIRLEP
jgi:hypothetical protein